MGNHIMEHRRPQINTTSPIVSKVVVIETQIQPAKVVIT
jgi:hypothetical protein